MKVTELNTLTKRKGYVDHEIIAVKKIYLQQSDLERLKTKECAKNSRYRNLNIRQG